MVTADGVTVTKPADEVSADAALQAAPAHPWVSRGGVKLAAALDHFGIDPAGRICLDVGASTGGFTQVLLARGARRVYAVDVGRGQLHASLRGAPDVVAIEATDIRKLEPAQARRAARSRHRRRELHLAQARAARRARAGAAAGRGGRADQAAIRGRARPRQEGHGARPGGPCAVCADVAALVASLGWTVVGVIPSPIAGGDGNHEFLIGRPARLAGRSPFSCHGIRYGAAP